MIPTYLPTYLSLPPSYLREKMKGGQIVESYTLLGLFAVPGWWLVVGQIVVRIGHIVFPIRMLNDRHGRNVPHRLITINAPNKHGGAPGPGTCHSGWAQLKSKCGFVSSV